MKVAKQPPAAIKTPVMVSENEYELWYLKPIKLGNIHRNGNYWYTEDGVKFMNSRDALEYLLRIHEGREVTRDVILGQIEKTQAAVDVPANVAVSVRKLPHETPPSKRGDSKKKPLPEAIKKRTEPKGKRAVEAYNQNHPEFQKFLDFQEFLKNQNSKKHKD